jgi:hypothetical protein
MRTMGLRGGFCSYQHDRFCIVHRTGKCRDAAPGTCCRGA